MIGTLPKWREHVLPSENKNPNRVLRCKRRNPEAIAMASAKRTSSTKREEAGAAVLETMSGQVETAIDLVGRCKPGATRASSESSIQPYNKKQKTVADHFKGLALQKQVDALMQKFVVDAALPFSSMDNPFLIAAFKAASQGSITPPSGFTVRNQGLKELELEVDDAKLREIEDRSGQEGLRGTITSDGWENSRNESFTNYLLLWPRSQGLPTFLTSFYCGAKEKTAEMLSTQFDSVMTTFFEGKEHTIAAFVPDSASNMVKCRKLIEEQYPHIVTYPCNLHGINWIYKDAQKVPWVQNLQQCAKILVRIFTKHQRMAAVLKAESKAMLLFDALGLKKPAETRVLYWYFVVERLVFLKPVLQSCFETIVFKEELIKAAKRKLFADGLEICLHHPADSEKNEVSTSFWNLCKWYLFALEPLVIAAKTADSNQQTLCELWPLLDAASARVKSVDQQMWDNSFRIRWDAASLKTTKAKRGGRKKLHLKDGDGLGAAYCLNTKYFAVAETKSAPQEAEVALLQVLSRLAEDETQKERFLNSWLAFSCGDVPEFQTEVAKVGARVLTPIGWWIKFGSLAMKEFTDKAALPILSMHQSNTAAEKDWSQRAFIQPKSRSTLKPKQAVRLHNARMGVQKQRITLMKDIGHTEFSKDPTQPRGDESLDDDDGKDNARSSRLPKPTKPSVPLEVGFVYKPRWAPKKKGTKSGGDERAEDDDGGNDEGVASGSDEDESSDDGGSDWELWRKYQHDEEESDEDSNSDSEEALTTVGAPATRPSTRLVDSINPSPEALEQLTKLVDDGN